MRPFLCLIMFCVFALLGGAAPAHAKGHCAETLAKDAMARIANALPSTGHWLQAFEGDADLPPRLKRLLTAYSGGPGAGGFRIKAVNAEQMAEKGRREHKGLNMAQRPRADFNGKTHYRFQDGDQERQVCEVYVRSDISPEQQMLTVIHELAHCRFEQFWRRNHQRLARHLPATIAFHGTNGATFVSEEYFDGQSEAFALSSELQVAQEIQRHMGRR